MIDKLKIWKAAILSMAGLLAISGSVAARAQDGKGVQPGDPPGVVDALPGCGEGVPAINIPQPPPPEKRKFASSPGDVDMRSGSFSFENVDVSVGGQDTDGLALVRSFSYNDGNGNFPVQSMGKFFTHNWDIELRETRTQRSGACYPSQFGYSITVMFGALGESFRGDQTDATYDGTSPVAFQQVTPAGYAELIALASTNNPKTFVFTARDGTVVNFIPLASGYSSNYCGSILRCTFASSVIRPDGTTYNLSYDTISGSNFRRLRNVVSNRGYALLFNYPSATSTLVTQVCAINLSNVPLPANNACPTGAAAATYAYASPSVQTSATDSGGGTWRFTEPTTNAFAIKRPGQSQPFVTNSYIIVKGTDDSDASLAVDSQTFSDGRQYSYIWDTISSTASDGAYSVQVAGGKWTDGNNKSVIVKYGGYLNPNDGPYSQIEYPTPGPESVTDELGRITTYFYCDPAQSQCYIPPLQSMTEPEGNKEVYSYTAYNNLSQTTYKAKPASGLSDLVDTRNYPAFGSSTPVQRAKPTSIVDRRGNATTYTYDAVHGGILTEVGPAVGGVSPAKKYAYAQRYAWVRNAAGTGYEQAASPVWVRTEERSCKASALNLTTGACGVASDLIVTAYDYGPNSGPNNLWLRGVAVTADGVTLRSCYGYDAMGNKVSETKPRAGLTSCP